MIRSSAIIKKHFIDEKINKQRFQEDVAQPLQTPVTTALNTQQEKLDEYQNKLIVKLQEGQVAFADTQ